MAYALPITILALILPAFFTLARRRFAGFGRAQTGLQLLLALALCFSASRHFLSPGLFASTIPPGFSHRYSLAIVSGILEAAGGLGLLIDRTRRVASVCLGVLMVAVFPANIYIAGRTIGGIPMPGVGVRAAMQVVFVILILLAGWGIPGREDRVEG